MECLCRSLHRDAGSLDHLGPLLGRFSNKRGELGPGADEWNVTQLNRPRAELRISNASVNFAMQSFYDFNRGVSRSANSLPCGSLIAWYELSDGRHVRQHWRADGGRYTQRAQFTRLDVFYRCCQGIEHDRDFAGENIGERGSGAAILNHDQVNACHHLEQFAVNVRRAANTRRRVIDSARVGFCISNKFWTCLGWKIRMHLQDAHAAIDASDWYDVSHDVEMKVVVERLIYCI